MASPVISTIPTQASTVGDTIALDIDSYATDADVTDTLTFSASGFPSGTGLALDPATGIISGTVTQQDIDASPYVVPVMAMDTDLNSDTVDFTFVDQGAGASERDELAGIYIVWLGQDDFALADLAIVKGTQITQLIANAVTTGDYAPASAASYSTVTQRVGWLEARTNGDEKGIHLQVYGKKTNDWQKHVWYLDNASSFGESKREDTNWIGAFWSADGIDVMKGIFNLGLYAHENTLTVAQRSRCIGMRITAHAIGVEDDTPDSATGKEADNYVQGADASASRPADWTTSVKNSAIAQLYTHVLDELFPDGDDQPPVAIGMFRPKNMEVDAALNARALTLIANNVVGYLITAAEPEPRNNTHVNQLTAIKTACKVAGGNTRCFAEPYGAMPSSKGADYSNLQLTYWTGLCMLHSGVSYIAFRPRDLENYDTTPDTALEIQWKAAFDFIDKYAGYEQFPSTSPGAWVAFRGGARYTGNYTMLATQITTGAADAGTDQQAADNQIGVAVGSVGPKGNGTTDGTTNNGAGDRQSLYCKLFASGDHAKIVLDSTFAASLQNQDVVVNIHYLDDGTTAVLTPTIFNVAQTATTCTNTDVWTIASYAIDAADIDVDVDGAHVSVAVTGAGCRLHMIEVTRA